MVSNKKSNNSRGTHSTNKQVKKRTLSKKLIVWGLKIALVSVAVFFFIVLLVYLGLFGRLPSEAELQKVKNNTASLVYSIDGKIMGGYYIQNRQTISNRDVSPFVKDALISTEDSRFFEHKGLDFTSISRVIVKTILFGDSSQGGGSTISQQLAKNLYPRKGTGLLSLLINKIREGFIASRLESVYSKEDILIMYLNTVPFGEDIYGIETASFRFFSKKSKFLNPSEAATLVGMLAANTKYNPRLNPDLSKARRNIVLKRMYEHNCLTEEEYNKWINTPIELNYNRIDRNSGIAPYFREKIRLKAEEILEDKYGDGYNLYTDGLKIYTTIDSRMQHYADDAVGKHMTRLQKAYIEQWKGTEPWRSYPSVFTDAVRSSKRYAQLKESGLSEEKIMEEMEKPVKMTIYEVSGEKEVLLSPIDSVKNYLSMLNIGFMAMDAETGYILAWIGGINHKVFEYDHVTSKRQVGSTFKPFVYSIALLDGIEPCEFIKNEKRVYSDYDNWSPGNSGGNYEGYYSVKGGLANSVNTIAAELIMKTGVDDVVDLAHELGIESNIPEYPSIALGTADISLYEMIQAYSVFPNLGTTTKPVGLLKIEDKDGNLLYEYKSEQNYENVLDSEVAAMMVEMMKGVIERGTGRPIRSIYGVQSELCGKTGTTQDNTDGWFIAYTPTLVTGAWVGNDIPAIRFRTTGLGQGSSSALPAVGMFLNRLEADPRFNKYTMSSFQPLPGYLAMKLECDDYSLEDPNMSFLERLFGGSSKAPDSNKLKDKEEKKKEKGLDRPGLLEKMKELFRKK